MDKKEYLIAIKNRMNRKPYIIMFILYQLAPIIWGLSYMLNIHPLASLVGLFILTILICSFIIFTIARLHDLELSGMWALIIPIAYIYPLINHVTIVGGTPFISFLSNSETLSVFVLFVLGMFLCVKKGTDGPNKYGPDPLQKDEDIQEEIK